MKLLEYVPDLGWERVRGNFQIVDDFLSLLGRDADGFGFRVAGVRVRFGADTLAWTTGQQLSASKTISHGLGKTPVFVGAFGSDASTPQLFFCNPFTFTTTQFSVRGAFAGTTTAGSNLSLSISWVVIG